MPFKNNNVGGSTNPSCCCGQVSCFCQDGFNDPNDFIGDVLNWTIGSNQASTFTADSYILAKNPTCAPPHSNQTDFSFAAGKSHRFIVDSDSTFTNAHVAEVDGVNNKLNLYSRSGGVESLLYSGECASLTGGSFEYTAIVDLNTDNVFQILLREKASGLERGAIATSVTRFNNSYYGVASGSIGSVQYRFRNLNATSRNSQCAPIDLGCLICNPPSMPKEIDVTIAGLTGDSGCPTACTAFNGTYTLKQGLYFPDNNTVRQGLCFWGFRLPTPIIVPCGAGSITLAAVTARYISGTPNIIRVEMDEQVNIPFPTKILQADITNPTADCNAWSNEGPQSSFQPGARCIFGATPSITVTTSVPGP